MTVIATVDYRGTQFRHPELTLIIVLLNYFINHVERLLKDNQNVLQRRNYNCPRHMKRNSKATPASPVCHLEKLYHRLNSQQIELALIKNRSTESI